MRGEPGASSGHDNATKKVSKGEVRGVIHSLAMLRRAKSAIYRVWDDTIDDKVLVQRTSRALPSDSSSTKTAVFALSSR